MKRNLFAILTLMLFSLATITVQAGEVCGNCDRGTIIYEYQDVVLPLASVGKCSHYSNGIDTVEETCHQWRAHCTNCEYNVDWRTSYSDYRLVCHGYN